MLTLWAKDDFRRIVGACVLGIAVAASQASAQQVGLPQDIFGQLSIGVNTRLSTRFGRDLSGSIEGMIGTHRAFRSWYRPSAISGGVTRLFAGRCQAQGIGDCLQPVESIPWLTVVTGAENRVRIGGTLRVMAGLGAAYVRGTFANSPSLVPAFEARVDYMMFPRPHVGATLFLRNLNVTDRNASQANGIALGVGVARR